MAIEKDIKSLESRIGKAIEDIRGGIQTPKDSKIGELMNLLKGMDIPAYEKAFAAYKPVSQEWFDKYRASPEYAKIKAAEDKKKKEIAKKALEFASALSSNGGASGGYSDDEVTQGPRNFKAKELKEKKVAKVKLPKAVKEQKEKGDRDKSEYNFNGEVFRKGPLIRAVVREHVRLNPKITFDLLKKVFPDEWLKGYGIFQTYEKAMDVSKKVKRYFLNDVQLIHVKNNAGKPCAIAVCSQISKDNMVAFLTGARKLGYKID